MIRFFRSALALSCFGCAISFSTLHLHAQAAPPPATNQQPSQVQQQPRVIQRLEDLSPQQRQQYEQMQQQAWQEAERQRQYQLQLQQQRQLQQQDPRMAQQPGGVNRTQYIDGGNPNGQNPAGGVPGQPMGQPLQNPQQNPGIMNPGAGNPGQGGNPHAPVPNPGMTIPPVQIQPRNPLPLTAAEEQELDRVLLAWEQANSAIKTFKCDFKLWEYNATWGARNDKGEEIALRESIGTLRYEAPDKGQYRTTRTDVYNTTTKAFENTGADDLKYWACDGKSMYTIDNKKKERHKYNLPENLRGSAITEGPLPFVFGLKADKLKARYWMKVMTPPNVAGKKIIIEAIPKLSSDAFNYQKLDIIIVTNTMNPEAIQIHKPGGKERDIYELTKHEINAKDGFLTGIFVGKEGIVPELPRGYKDVEDNFVDPTSAQAQAQAQARAMQGRPAMNGQGAIGNGQAPHPTQPGNPQIGNNVQPNHPQMNNGAQNPAPQNYVNQTGNNVAPNYQQNNLPQNGGYPNNYNPNVQNPNGVNPNPTNQAMGPGAPLR